MNATNGLQTMCQREELRRRFLNTESKKEGGHNKEEHDKGGHGAHDTSKLDVVLFLFLCLFVGNFFK